MGTAGIGRLPTSGFVISRSQGRKHVPSGDGQQKPVLHVRNANVRALLPQMARPSCSVLSIGACVFSCIRVGGHQEEPKSGTLKPLSFALSRFVNNGSHLKASFSLERMQG